MLDEGQSTPTGGCTSHRRLNQRIDVIAVEDYVYLVPFVESDEEVFLKTIIPSRKATRLYRAKRNEQP